MQFPYVDSQKRLNLQVKYGIFPASYLLEVNRTIGSHVLYGTFP